ncbi:MAG TPA: ATP-binding cassette domain-containing protein [Candidatus Saccharimonadales bacterium]
MATEHVTISHFSMSFGRKKVIDDLSFNVKKGEVFGFLGSNGSGKTTTLRALLGIYEPTAGELLIDGQRYQSHLSGKLGYLPEERGLYRKETVIDIMVYFGMLKQMSRRQAHDWSLAYLERVGLLGKQKMKLEKLSGGQQQKIQLGVTMMNQPELLILDEPTKGLDPVNRRLLMEMVEEQNQRGATVILVTHQMEEVERLCDRIVMLKDGKRRAYGTTDDVRGEFGGNIIALRFRGELPRHEKLYEIHKQLPHFAELRPAAGVQQQAILQKLAKEPSLELSLFEVRKPSLDDVFVAIYGETAAKEA